MIARQELVRVEPDADAANASLEEARRHVESAEAIGDRDRNGAFQLAYDAARKAVAAHMRRAGIRVGSGEGGHMRTAAYAEHAVDAELGQLFDGARRRRNRSEYGTAHIGARELEQAIVLAKRLIDAVEE